MVITRGPMESPTNTLRDGEEDVTFAAGDVWIVSVVAVDRFGQESAPATGTFLIEDAMRIRFNGFILE